MNKTDKLLAEIEKLNTTKDEGLATRLHELAGKYQRRPQEGWTAPAEWECWKDEPKLPGGYQVRLDGSDRQIETLTVHELRRALAQAINVIELADRAVEKTSGAINDWRNGTAVES